MSVSVSGKLTSQNFPSARRNIERNASTECTGNKRKSGLEGIYLQVPEALSLGSFLQTI